MWLGKLRYFNRERAKTRKQQQRFQLPEAGWFYLALCHQ
jgi:hypothetical protein